MARPPLPDPVARRARTYLAALVPADEVSDAWHELVADATYWGDREEIPVLRLAHQVVLQHQRVTHEAAALALDEAGVSSPPAVAQVLDLEPAEAEALLHRVAESVADVEREPDVHVFDAEVGAVGTAHEAAAPPAETDPEPAPPAADTTERQTTGSGPAMRIGFEDDDVISVDEWEESNGVDLRRWGGVLLVVLAAVILLWLLLG